MSDSFADLWNSSAPSKPAQPQKLGSGVTNPAQRRPQKDVFALLSSAGSSAPSSRPITPSTGSLGQQKPITKSAVKSETGGDAFSGLLAGSLSGGSNNGGRMTIAERAAQVEKERLAKLQKQPQHVPQQTSSAWDGLDTLASNSSSSISNPSKSSELLDVDSWVLPSPVPSRGAPLDQKPLDDDDWGLDDFSAPTPPVQKSHTQRTQKLWELDDFSSPSVTGHSPPSAATLRPRKDSLEDFDFGNREDALLDDGSNDEEDILGVLSKPVDAASRLKSPPSEHRAASSKPSTTNGKSIMRPVSPPPHILGQIVEMGFSVQQARIALAATDTGLDVQAALETLLSNGAASTSHSTPPPHAEHHPQPRSATRLMPQEPRDTHSPSNSQTDRDKERNLQEQADKILAQASEIGLSVFNKASSFWKEGKERVQKAYEERASSVAGSSAGGAKPRDGRPKWMQEAENDAADDDWKDERGEAGFSDDILPQKPTRATAKPKQAPIPEPQTPDLFSVEPEAYQSPFRRGKPQQRAQSAPQAAASPLPNRPRPRAPSPIRAAPRANVVSASISSITRSTKHKDLGGEKFKLGQYGDAEVAYTSAIACLPDSHLLLVPLYNNRALARLKTGHHPGAIEDASKAIEIIGPGYHPAREEKVTRLQEGSGVDLGDALVKALKRRAEAWEGREKWEEAGRDWETLAALEWAKSSLRGEAVRGAGRCRRTVQATAASNTEEPSARPKQPRPAPPRRVEAVVFQSQAVENLRNASDAAEAEDQQRHELKDKVDAKLLAWKGGKEANIRALLGSLDTVLWPELGLQKVGMADLVSSSQVKIKYTKTIAKLHPDKLNANNTTVEQRMIANGVFGALNEAWNAFKQ